jgi:TetR/AcrR family transcriptional repressor of nem operon
MPWDKQFNRDAVLDKAMQAFWSRGYAATSMQDLVDCMGVNRGSLYATFGDKHELFLAALHMFDERVRQQLLTSLAAQYPPREAIRQLFLAFLSQAALEGGNRGCLLTNTALELAAHDRDAAQIVANAQREIEGFFRTQLESGVANGQIPAASPVVETARGLLGSLLGLMVLIRSRPEPTLLQSVVDDALRRLE